jgi:hypothetical protein
MEPLQRPCGRAHRREQLAPARAEGRPHQSDSFMGRRRGTRIPAGVPT